MQKKLETPQRELTQEEKMALLDSLRTPSVDQLIQKLEELVRMALEAEHMEPRKNIPFVEIMQDLALVKKALDAISADQENINVLVKYMKEHYPPQQEIKKDDKQEHRQMEKLKELTEICEAARDRLHAELTANPQTEERVKEIVEESSATPKRKTTRRKRKFRSMGGEEWIKS